MITTDKQGDKVSVELSKLSNYTVVKQTMIRKAENPKCGGNLKKIFPTQAKVAK